MLAAAKGGRVTVASKAAAATVKATRAAAIAVLGEKWTSAIPQERRPGWRVAVTAPSRR